MSIINARSLNHLASLNLDEEGAKILQEMVDAITLAIEKCNQLETIILKSTSKAKPLPVPVLPVGKIKISPGLETPSEPSTSNDRKETPQERLAAPVATQLIDTQSYVEEPTMPLPMVIKQEKPEQHPDKEKELNLSLNISNSNHISQEEFIVYLSVNENVSEGKIWDFLYAQRLEVVKVSHKPRGSYCFASVQLKDSLNYKKCLEMSNTGVIDGASVTIRPWKSPMTCERGNYANTLGTHPGQRRRQSIGRSDSPDSLDKSQERCDDWIYEEEYHRRKSNVGAEDKKTQLKWSDRHSTTPERNQTNSDIHGIVYLHWVTEAETFNQQYYPHILSELRERIRKTRPELWKNKTWILHKTMRRLILLCLSRGFYSRATIKFARS